MKTRKTIASKILKRLEHRYITTVKYDKENDQFIIKSTNTDGGAVLFAYRSFEWCKEHLNKFDGITHNWDIVKVEHNRWFEL